MRRQVSLRLTTNRMRVIAEEKVGRGMGAATLVKVTPAMTILG
ncbi:hypothetical protein [Scytonema millei]|nr:hypothetical protein [Scytonema millei]